MVDQDLRDAATNLSEVVVSLDPMALLTGAAGLGLGLFGAEFAGEFSRNMTEGMSSIVRFGADVGSRALTAVLFFLGRGIGGALINTLMILGAFGASASAVLRILEEVAGGLADQVSAPTEASFENHSEVGDITPNVSSSGGSLLDKAASA